MNTCFRSVFAIDWNSNRNEEQKSCNWKKISSWRKKKWKHKVFSLWSKTGSKPAYHQEYQPSSIQQRNFLHYSLIWRVYYFPNRHYSRLVKKQAYISVPITLGPRTALFLGQQKKSTNWGSTVWNRPKKSTNLRENYLY